MAVAERVVPEAIPAEDLALPSRSNKSRIQAVAAMDAFAPLSKARGSYGDARSRKGAAYRPFQGRKALAVSA